MSSKKELEKHIEELEKKIDSITEQVEEEIIVHEVRDYSRQDNIRTMMGIFPERKVYEATLNGKIEQIARHLGIEFEIEPQKTVTTGPRIKIVTQKPTAKKSKKK